MRDIAVIMRISWHGMEWIREDSVAHLDSKGLLGDKLINISIGSPELPAMKPNSMLISAIPLDLSKSLQEAQKILESVQDIFQTFKNEGGEKALVNSVKSIEKILKEVEGSNIKGSLVSLNSSLNNVENITNAAKSGDLIKNLNKTSSYIESLAKDIYEGHGSLGLLIKDPSLYNELYGLIGNLRRNALLKAVIRHNLSNTDKGDSR
jgi:phospholipid/cholesterol/gamma-HCH transport system substrate-binding protein